MSDIVVISAHPNLSTSRANRILLEAISDLPFISVRKLYEIYPDGKIDISAEQEALTLAKNIVFQFPLYWYSCPALLKEWIDKVFTEGFAYGEGAQGIRGKRLLVAVTADAAEDFCAPLNSEGKENLFYLSDALRPFKATATYCDMIWESEFAVFAVWQQTDEQLREEGKRYRKRLEELGD